MGKQTVTFRSAKEAVRAVSLLVACHTLKLPEGITRPVLTELVEICQRINSRFGNPAFIAEDQAALSEALERLKREPK